MKKTLTIACFLLAPASFLYAQNWSFGAATGPFVFGDFVERSFRPGNEQGAEDPQKQMLTAGTRVGIALDLERKLSDRWAVRLEGTFTRAPLAIQNEGGVGDGVEIDSGEVDVSTWMLPLVFRINRGGAFRFHLLGGPALALYHARARDNAEGADPAFEGVQQEWGVAFGGGIGWWMSDRLAIEGNLTDTITSSPFDREDFPDVPGIVIKRPHNVHTTVGVRWRF